MKRVITMLQVMQKRLCAGMIVAAVLVSGVNGNTQNRAKSSTRLRSSSSKVERLWPAWVRGFRDHIRPHTESTVGALHEVVGEDGVLMISLEDTPERYDYSTSALRRVGAHATKFPATDVSSVSPEQLASACPLRADAGGKADQEGWCMEHGKAGPGCASQIEQAIADSHRRALVQASKRDIPWTAIMEDDMIPVDIDRWGAAFKKAWAKVPPQVRIVRLSWCTFLFNDTRTLVDVEPFRLIDWVGRESDGIYQAGGCTGAYIVHQDIIPELLNVFPCCCGLDCCLAWDFYNKKTDSGKTVGQTVMLNMDAHGSTEFARGFTEADIKQSGIFVQDNRILVSTRDP